MKLLSRDPKDFHKLLTKKIGDEEGLVIHGAGLRGLAVETTEAINVPEATESEAKVTKESLVVFVKLIYALMNGYPVKLVPEKKSWRVCFGPKGGKKQAKNGG